MADSTDWRLQGQEEYLRGATLVRRTYREYEKDPRWDHDHCEFCWAKFAAEDAPGVIHTGYATEDGYRWICETCFQDFRQMFKWKVDPADDAEGMS
jgi:hypothetical protein